MEDVAAEEVSKSYRLLNIQEPNCNFSSSGAYAFASLDAGESRLNDIPVCALRSESRTGLGGWDIWAPLTGGAAIETLVSGFPKINHEAYNIARLETGIPFFGSDMGERTMPPEMGNLAGLCYATYQLFQGMLYGPGSAHAGFTVVAIRIALGSAYSQNSRSRSAQRSTIFDDRMRVSLPVRRFHPTTATSARR